MRNVNMNLTGGTAGGPGAGDGDNSSIHNFNDSFVFNQNDYSGRNISAPNLMPQSTRYDPIMLIKNMKGEQKYWKYVIRGILFQMSFWITNTNGLLNQYLQLNGGNYKALKTVIEPNQASGKQTYKRPINYRLTSIVM